MNRRSALNHLCGFVAAIAAPLAFIAQNNAGGIKGSIQWTGRNHDDVWRYMHDRGVESYQQCGMTGGLMFLYGDDGSVHTVHSGQWVIIRNDNTIYVACGEPK